MSAGGSGAFTTDESIYQGPSLANATFKGIVVSWDATTRVLRLNDTSGAMAASTNVIGATSSASWSLSSTTDSTGKADVDQVLPTDPNADNLEFEIEADSILDFSENNPFGDVR